MSGHMPGWRHIASGKVRDLFVPDTAEPASVLLVVASDRISAFDHVLRPELPGKGALLTGLTRWWFRQLPDIPNHRHPDDSAADEDGAAHVPAAVPDTTRTLPAIPPEIAPRAMLCRMLRMLPVECVVRGYLAGSGWQEYRETGAITGIPLPPGLHEGDQLPAPIFTPARKAPHGEHDENISFAQLVTTVGDERATVLAQRSLDVYRRAAALAATRGLILADTKFEFGEDATGAIVLADEVLTSDSSRYWDADAWHTGTTPAARMASFDKQSVRDWLRAHWDGTGPPPELPPEVVADTLARYRDLTTRLVRA